MLQSTNIPIDDYDPFIDEEEAQRSITIEQFVESAKAQESEQNAITKQLIFGDIELQTEYERLEHLVMYGYDDNVLQYRQEWRAMFEKCARIAAKKKLSTRRNDEYSITNINR